MKHSKGLRAGGWEGFFGRSTKILKNLEILRLSRSKFGWLMSILLLSEKSNRLYAFSKIFGTIRWSGERLWEFCRTRSEKLHTYPRQNKKPIHGSCENLGSFKTFCTIFWSNTIFVVILDRGHYCPPIESCICYVLIIFHFSLKSITLPCPIVGGGLLRRGVGKNGQKNWENFETKHGGYVKWV